VKNYAVIIVTKNRWEYSEQCLNSLSLSEHSIKDYDLFLIDNGSHISAVNQLKYWMRKGMNPVKNVFFLKREVPVSVAFNLGLLITKYYPWRVKMDNDIVLHNTPMEQTAHKPGRLQPTPEMSDPQSIVGAVASYVGGVSTNSNRAGTVPATKQIPTRSRVLKGSRFLDLMSEFSVNTNLGISALVPVEIGKKFGPTLQAMGQNYYKNEPYLTIGCGMINKTCFDKIGYFDESWPRQIDIEYSQRAMANGINVGYHDQYYVQHIGVNPTEGNETLKMRNIEIANRADANQPERLTKSFVSTKWERAENKIKEAAKKNVIVELK